MADAARPLAVVNRPTAATGQAGFAACVREVLEAHGDIAAEGTWQALSLVIVEHWLLLANDQRPLDTWGMLSRCAETVLKLRRAAQGSQRASGDDALEEFRAMMHHVAGEGIPTDGD